MSKTTDFSLPFSFTQPPPLPPPPLVYRPVTLHNHHLGPPSPPCSLFFAVDACTTLHSGRQRTVVMGDFLSAHVRVPGCLIILPDSYTDSIVKDFLSVPHTPDPGHTMLVQEQIQLNDLVSVMTFFFFSLRQNGKVSMKESTARTHHKSYSHAVLERSANQDSIVGIVAQERGHTQTHW